MRGVTGLTRLDLLRGQTASAAQLAQLQQLWQKRITTQIPLQYLLGAITWRGLDLVVAPGILIPRPETELLIEWVLEYLSPDASRLVDAGTGSGCLGIALALALPQAEVWAVDLSPHCLKLAQINAQRQGVHERMHFIQGSWLEPIVGPVDAVISNPPYIPTAMVAALDPQVRDHEPHLALDGGDDGLSAIRVLISQGATILTPGGLWAIEAMRGQFEAVCALLRQHGGYTSPITKPDLEGNQRFILAQKI